ncbi:ribonuclease [Bacillus subtilis]|nr:ribonuclease [Bacillus subtilis]
MVGGDATKVTGKLAGTVSKTNKSAKYVESSVKAKKVLNSFTEVSDFVAKNGRLPVNYITKGEARKLGWDSKKGNLSKVAPGKSIGGDIYKNREKLLPEAKNRVWREADINYTTGYRGNDRLLYSNDGLIYKTTDHYKTFVKLK